MCYGSYFLSKDGILFLGTALEERLHLVVELTLLHSEGPKLYIGLSECKLTLLHSERPKLYTILVFLSAIGHLNIVNRTVLKYFFLSAVVLNKTSLG